jgi:hypothetical protein
MRYKLLLLCTVLQHVVLVAQQPLSQVEGTVVDILSGTALPGVVITLEGETATSLTGANGAFRVRTMLRGEYILSVLLPDYREQRIPVNLNGTTISLGTLYLERDLEFEKQDNLIALTESELLDDDSGAGNLGLLQATRDVFLNRAAFDFGQAFFRVRGYDSQNGEVMLNGLPMNKFLDGRPQWNNWGGLNDVVRNQSYTNGLEANAQTFGGILGNTNIDLRPSRLRKGVRLSSSVSNRTYSGRAMATYNSGTMSNGLAYMVSASRRWAQEGYIDGTLYDAHSLFGAVEYQWNKKNTLLLSALWAKNRRGRSSALTEEVFQLVGKKYNPHWGPQDGEIRNARERTISEPLVLLHYFYESDKVDIQAGMAFQTGTNRRSRVGHYNAPNPDPTYFRYLPSFYINSPIGANFINANLAKEGFLDRPQLDWGAMYTANANPEMDGQASYVLYDDAMDDTQFTAKVNGNMRPWDAWQFTFGLSHMNLTSKNYAEIVDLMGASFHADIDPFSDTANDLGSDPEKSEGDIFNYNYALNAHRWDGFLQLEFDHNNWKGFLAAQFMATQYQREGFFQNGRFLDNSKGAGDALAFSDVGLKAGLRHRLSGRHWLVANAGRIDRPPVMQHVYVNPRESSQRVKDIASETITTADINYYLRMPALVGRLTGYYTRFQNTTDVNFFFVDSGLGSDFVQEVITNMDKLHMGLEMGLEYTLSPSVKLSAAAALGKFLYANDPNVSINFDTAAPEEELIDVTGSKDLGLAALKDHRLAQGPQSAFSLGVEYRDPKYWWVGMTANYLAENYANVSTIARTNSFLIDPKTGQTFPQATPENVAALLRQTPLDRFYLLNFTAGKSWLRKGKYVGIFLNINNAFDQPFRTGGFEQSRNGNFGQWQRDNLSGTPSFAPRYWYGYGRTFFLNVAYSF